MSEPHRPIFRVDAVRRYTQSKEKLVLPRLISPAFFFSLWVLLGLLLAGGVGVWLMVASRIY